MCFSCYIIITMMNYVKLYLLLEIYIPEPGDIIFYAYPSEPEYSGMLLCTLSAKDRGATKNPAVDLEIILMHHSCI